MSASRTNTAEEEDRQFDTNIEYDFDDDAEKWLPASAGASAPC